MPAKKVLTVLLIIAVATGGFITGLILLRQEQDIREKAAVPGGEVTVLLSPSSGTYNVGSAFKSSISFNTANISVSGIAIRLSYPYSGVTPELVIDSIDVNPTLLSSGDWTCPTKTFNLEGGKVVIDIACGNYSASGYSSGSGDTLFADIMFRVDRVPVQSPVVVSFDPNLSIITRKSNGQDILLIPASTGAYTIPGSAVPTNTPTPTTKAGAIATSTPTPTKKLTPTPTKATTLTPTPTKKVTATPTNSLTITPTPTQTETLPDAGVSFPTILTVGLGVLLVVGGLLLAI